MSMRCSWSLTGVFSCDFKQGPGFEKNLHQYDGVSYEDLKHSEAVRQAHLKAFSFRFYLKCVAKNVKTRHFGSRSSGHRCPYSISSHVSMLFISPKVSHFGFASGKSTSNFLSCWSRTSLKPQCFIFL